MQTSTPTAAAGQPATHPSRNAPKCVDCQHCAETFNGPTAFSTLWCNHPIAALDLVSGKCQDRCDVMRKLRCGFDGALYEESAPKCPTCNGRGRLRQPYASEVTDCPDCSSQPAATFDQLKAERLLAMSKLAALDAALMFGNTLAGAPSSYQPATWRGTLPPDDLRGVQGIAFDLSDGTVLRLLLAQSAVQDVLETLAPGYWSRSAQGNHSDASSLMSSDPKSVPSDGVNVCPPAASSTACTKEP